MGIRGHTGIINGSHKNRRVSFVDKQNDPTEGFFFNRLITDFEPRVLEDK